MGVRKRIVGCPICHQCSLPIDGKGYRLPSVGVDALMHANCASHHWHETYTKKENPVPLADLKVYSALMMDIMLLREHSDRYGVLWSVRSTAEIYSWSFAFLFIASSKTKFRIAPL